MKFSHLVLCFQTTLFWAGNAFRKHLDGIENSDFPRLLLDFPTVFLEAKVNKRVSASFSPRNCIFVFRLRFFLRQAFGGPLTKPYSGKAMQTAHKKPRERGLGSSQFDAVCEYLVATLQELKVDQDDINSVVGIWSVKILLSVKIPI